MLDRSELASELSRVPGVCARAEEPMGRHVPLRVGGPAEVWAEVDDPESLIAALRVVRRAGVTWRVHWPFGDWLVRDGGIVGVTIRPGRGFEGLSVDGDVARIGMACPWASLAARPAAESWNDLAAWPATPGVLLAEGGGVRLAGRLVSVTIVDRGELRDVLPDDSGRLPELPEDSIPVSLALHAAPVRPARIFRAPPPRMGALFSDPDGDRAGRALTRAGLAGTRLRAWRFARGEPGTLVQLGGGTCRDLLILAKGVEERVEREAGARLERRIAVVGVERR